MEPAHRFSTAFVVKRGYASFKQDGLIAMWNKRWIVLREDQLSWHRSEVKTTKTAHAMTKHDVDASARLQSRTQSHLYLRVHALAIPPSLRSVPLRKRAPTMELPQSSSL